MKSFIALIYLGLISVGVARNIDNELELDITNRIVNGSEGSRDQFPYQAILLHKKENEDFWHLCGGSIISDQWILTAAHCVNDVDTVLEVHLGADINPFYGHNQKGMVSFNVSKENLIFHKGWNLQNLSDDIGLIKLPEKITFKEYIQPVKLPRPPYQSYAGDYAIASGFGQLNDAGDYPDILQWIKVPIMSNEECAPRYLGQVHNSSICIAQVEGKTTCFGDSGGPLVLNSDKRTLIGITSFNSEFCQNGYPAVFTRVSYYLDWIKEHTGVGVDTVENKIWSPNNVYVY